MVLMELLPWGDMTPPPCRARSSALPRRWFGDITETGAYISRLSFGVGHSLGYSAASASPEHHIFSATLVDVKTAFVPPVVVLVDFPTCGK